MMKHTQTIVAKSVVSRSLYPVAVGVKQSWEEIPGLVLGLAFFGGYTLHIGKKFYKRRQHWYKVDRMHQEHIKLSREYGAKLDKYLIYSQNMRSSLKDGEPKS